MALIGILALALSCLPTIFTKHEPPSHLAGVSQFLRENQ